MRGIKALLIAVALVAPVALLPQARAQFSISIGGPPPVCQYGYYNYAPYTCAPYGYYGQGYFYNGIFLGVGPWANWGYHHGWGRHRFSGARGGRYYPHGGYHSGYHGNHNNARYRGGNQNGNRGGHNNAYHGGARQNQVHSNARSNGHVAHGETRSSGHAERGGGNRGGGDHKGR